MPALVLSASYAGEATPPLLHDSSTDELPIR